MVALDVMHGEDEISRATVQVMKSRQATVTTNSPEQTFRQPSGRGMIPSSSCSQLGRLGFEAAEHVSSSVTAVSALATGHHFALLHSALSIHLPVVALSR